MNSTKTGSENTNNSNQIFEENEFGEMYPSQRAEASDVNITSNSINIIPAQPNSSLPRAGLPSPSRTEFVENKYGEILTPLSEETDLPVHHGDDPTFKEGLEDLTIDSNDGADGDDDEEEEEEEEKKFGKDTLERSAAFRSDEIYPENRFGELGRADTFEIIKKHEHLSDKIKGTYELSSCSLLVLAWPLLCKLLNQEKLTFFCHM